MHSHGDRKKSKHTVSNNMYIHITSATAVDDCKMEKFHSVITIFQYNH